VRRRSSPVFLRKLEKLFDIEVPSFEVGAHRSLALAALIDRHCSVVDDLEEGDHSLGLAVGSLMCEPSARTGSSVAEAPPRTWQAARSP